MKERKRKEGRERKREREGRKEGRKEGRREGGKEGRREGKKEGRKEMKLKVTSEMFLLPHRSLKTCLFSSLKKPPGLINQIYNLTQFHLLFSNYGQIAKRTFANKESLGELLLSGITKKEKL